MEPGQDFTGGGGGPDVGGLVRPTHLFWRCMVSPQYPEHYGALITMSLSIITETDKFRGASHNNFFDMFADFHILGRMSL